MLFGFSFFKKSGKFWTWLFECNEFYSCDCERCWSGGLKSFFYLRQRGWSCWLSLTGTFGLFFHDSSLFLHPSLCWGTRMPGPVLMNSPQVHLLHNSGHSAIRICLKYVLFALLFNMILYNISRYQIQEVNPRWWSCSSRPSPREEGDLLQWKSLLWSC